MHVTITDDKEGIQVDTEFDEYYDNSVYFIMDMESYSRSIAEEILKENDGDVNIDDVTKKVTEILNDGLKIELIDYIVYHLRNDLKE